ncbi:MAG: hypothetical protein AAGK04_00285 [Planctomycetota bacterium]
MGRKKLRSDERSERLERAARDRGGAGSRAAPEPPTWANANIKTGERPKPKRRLLKLTLTLLIILVVLLGLGIVFAPSLASGPARGFAERAINERIKGSAELSTLRLSWTGAQQVGPLVLKDEAGEVVARVDLELEHGLLAMARNDLGEIRVDGEARVVRGADGVTNLERVLEPLMSQDKNEGSGGGGGSGEGSGSPDRGGLPTGLRGTLVFDTLSLTYVDASMSGADGDVGAVAMRDVAGKATFETGQPITIKLDAEAMTAPNEEQLAQAANSAGVVTIDITATGFTSSSGAMTVENGEVDATITARDLSIAAADAVAAMNGRLVEALGDTASVSINAEGPVRDLVATFSAQSASVNATGALQYDGSRLTQTDPITITAQTQRLMALAPELRASMLEGEAARLEALPDISLRVGSLSIPLDTDEINKGRLDLRDGSIEATLSADGLSGTGRRSFRTEPLTLTLSAPKLSEPVTITANTRAEVDGQPAGEIDLSAIATGVLESSGAPRAGGPERVEATLDLKGLATAVLQPFATAAGLDLAEDVGRTLTASLSANTRLADANKGGVPDADVSLRIDAENLKAEGALTVRGGLLKTDGEGVRATVARVGPSLDRLLRSQGARIQQGGSAELVARAVSLDLERMGKGDLRGLAAEVTLTTGAIAGAFAPEGAAAESFTLRPTQMIVTVEDLASGVTLQAEPTGGDVQSGSITADLIATGLLNDEGALGGLPRSLTGSVQLAKAPTALAQPFVAHPSLNLPRDVGPSLTLTLSADARAVPGGASRQPGALPDTDLSLRLDAQHLEASGDLRLGRSGLRVVGEGLVVRAKRAGALAASLLDPEGPVTLDGVGAANVRVVSASVPFDTDAKPRLADIALDAALELGGMTVKASAPQLAQSPALTVNRLRVDAKRAKGEAATLTANGDMAYAGKPVNLEANLSAPGLVERLASGAFAVTPGSMPIGTVSLTGVPTGLVEMAGVELKSADGRLVNMRTLTEQLMGPTLDVTIEGSRPDDRSYSMRNTLTSATTQLRAPVVVRPDRIELGTSVLTARVSPSAADTLVGLFAPGMRDATAEPLRLTRPLVATLRSKPMRAPLTDEGALDPKRLEGETFSVSLTLDGATSPIVLKSAGAGQAPTRVGAATLDGVGVSLDGPTGALVPGGSPGDVRLTLDGRVAGEGDRTLASLDGQLDQRLRAGAPEGAPRGSVTLGELSTELADVVLGSPGMVSGAMGPTAAIEVLLDAATNDGAAGDLRANITSERFNTTRPLVLQRKADRLVLPNPMVADWTMTPEWGERFLLGRAPDAPDDPSAPRLTAPTRWRLNLRRLSLAQGEGVGLFKPGVFDLQAILETPKLALASGQQRLDMEGVRADVWAPDEPGRVEIRMDVDQVAGSPPSPNTKLLVASVRDAVDASGNLATDNAAVFGKAQVDRFPTAILDALAQQGGLLPELLGPTISLDATAQNFSKNGGYVNMVATSQRAHAVFQGDVRNGVLLTRMNSSTMRLEEITKQLSQRIIQGVPIAAEFEKQRGDDPAQLNIAQIAVPLDNDISKLNGVVTIDPGVLRFQTSSLFQRILKVGNQRDSGLIGQRLKPLQIVIEDGVVRYGKHKAGRYELPVGEFTAELEGVINLPQQKMDLVVWVPFGGLAADAAGAFGAGNLPFLDKATLMPFRVRGPFSNPGSAKPDAELFAKNVGPNLLKGVVDPAEGLGDGLKKILDGENPLEDILPKE